jgi:DNA processing protein
MDETLLYYLSFSHCYGIGPMRLKSLINHFGTVKKAYRAPIEEIKSIIGSHYGEEFGKFRHQFNPVTKLEELKKKEICVLHLESKHYPSSLKNIPDAPICLYVKGNLDNFDFTSSYLFAVVGTRKPTSYGELLTKKFTKELVQAGFNIVSGLALGVDAIAHQTTLDCGGKTIAVLGCGVDIIYPAANRNLYFKIIEKDGLIMSEFPPGHTVVKGLFVARNRIISGLSMGVLVTEGAKDSGALITVKYAANQGKDVFAPPAPITSEMSEAPNLLLKQGAKLVTSVEDILEEFNLKLIPKKQKEIQLQLNAEEKLIFESLLDEPRLANDLAVEANTTIDKILNTLSLLEIKGVIEKNSEGKYQLKEY